MAIFHTGLYKDATNCSKMNHTATLGMGPFLAILLLKQAKEIWKLELGSFYLLQIN